MGMGRYHSGPHGSVHPGVRGHRWYPENHGEMFTIFFSMEAHHQTALLCNDCDNAGIQILLYASCLNSSNLSASIKTAIRSCDSEMASSVPDKPLYFYRNLIQVNSQSIRNFTYCDTHTAGTEVICLLISFVAFGLRNNLCSLRSIGAFPF